MHQLEKILSEELKNQMNAFIQENHHMMQKLEKYEKEQVC